MTHNYFKTTGIFLLMCLLTSSIAISQVGIGTETPDDSSILDMQSTSAGLLIPRMTDTERDGILEPAEGLQVYNTTNKTLDIYIDGVWNSFLSQKSANANRSNLVTVYSVDDLPTPAAGAITLDATKMYVFSGMVDIGSNHIIMNGAGLRGTDPQKDGVMSSASGGVLRSTATNIFMQNFTVIPTAGSAYDFSGTAANFCNIFSGCSVIGGSVGQISGFNAITIIQNYWNVTDGVKVTGNVGKFTSSYNFIVGISSGAGVEFLAGLTANDIDMANNYFIYAGQTGIKVNAGAAVDRGRMTTNMFRDVTTPLSGIDSYSPGWSMKQNTNIPDSRAYSFIYFNGNTAPTLLPTQNFFTKIEGATEVVSQKRFTGNNTGKITYTDKEPITAKISVVISAKANENNSQYSIGIRKNNEMTLTGPVASMASTANNQSFQIILNTEVDLETDDAIEVYIARSNGSTDNEITVSELQFRVTD
ncbi:hypothetical protein ESY86_01365 [Subsaximicrobium wynnwilliamsii]|uniref:Uncharacterized protein n=1 Tax=Subsaximicrobium wynnwilliamsii TaxID=291179 RepID=A0A5C6ZLT9_9FLAO|nr:hypothetical protein [Subsaximicrobium wynnwilliamsii]TXD85221.1 hypothetical protein ESY87_02535 [Subsaximicrobium wynnwilliamsii]TXD91264.1 hypothetical protein ESY86_01365 [Subsaximicrobium wynnwilliamsii]TXE04657.1 hypothetical protein ESY88_04015 [Subsaximicrobium wynnwilliamsii]